jgi:hypothetical protein
LTTYNFVPVKYYTYHDRIMLVEVVSLENSDLFLLYIPKEYNFKPDSGYEVYELKRLHMDSKGNLPSKYATKLDDMELDEYYSKVNLLNTDKIMDRNVNIEEELIDEYRKRILVPSSEESMSIKVRDMINQLQRLDRCVDSNDYSLAIVTSNLIVLDPEHLYMIRSKTPKDERLYVVVVSLETMFKNANYISKDVPQLNQGIQRILMRNHQSHMEKMDATIDGMIDIQDKFHATVDRIKRYNEYIDKLKAYLARIKEKEASVRQARKTLQDKIASQGIEKEIYYLKDKSAIEQEEKWITQNKNKIYEKLLELYKKSRNYSMIMDKLLFENLIMMITIQRNMSIL